MLIKKSAVMALGLDIGPPHCFMALQQTQAGFQVTYITQADSFELLSLPQSPHRITLAIPDIAILSKLIEFDMTLTDREIESLLLTQTDLYIGKYEQALAFDFRRFDEKRVLVVATAKASLPALPSHLRLQSIDIESAAIQRCLRKLYQCEEKYLLLLLIDTHEFRLTLLENSIPIFKQRALYQNDLTHAFESLWFRLRTCFPMLVIKELYIGGKHQQIISIVEIIKKIVQISVSVINPFEKLAHSPTHASLHGSAFLVACGLALRGY